MTLKQFNISRVITATSLAAVLSQAIVLKNYYLVTTAIFIAVLLLVYLKKQVTEVTADERDYKIAGDAARWTMTVFGLLGAIGSFVLLTARTYNPYFEAAGSTLAYAVCVMLIINSLLANYLRYHRSEMPTGKKIMLTIFAVIVILGFVVLGLRLFSGEDTWLCQNGQWIQHGHPSLPAPTKICN